MPRLACAPIRRAISFAPMIERDYVQREVDEAQCFFLDGTSIEIIRRLPAKLPIRHALFDFDGTLSLIREGWPDVMIPMMVEMIRAATQPRETDAELAALVQGFIMELAGKQTIYQMIRLADEIKARGGISQDPLVYKKMFHDRLMARIAGRREALRSGAAAPEQYLVPFSREILAALRQRSIAAYVASGTDEAYVREEVALLKLTDYFAGIFGARDDYHSFSKEMVVRRILEEHRVKGESLLVIGDGYVEIQDGKAAGGVSVAVASDETGKSGRPDPWKRKRLIGAGADIVIPDYRDYAALLDYICA